MKHYYLTTNNEKGLVEVTESEFFAVIGNETTRPYAGKVYRGELSIEEVPEEVREAVATCVANRVARFGKYSEKDIADKEALNIITGGSKS